MSRRLALDLFCGAGGASMGLYRAGFDVVGIDIKKQPRYPFTFIQGDALRPPADLSRFDLIWASPPCQAYSVGNIAARRSKRVAHPDLLPRTRELLSGYECTVIENVVGAPLRCDLALDGTMFGLGVIKRRHFEASFPLGFRLGFDASGLVERGRMTGLRLQGRHRRSPFYAEIKKRHLASEVRSAMDCDWIVGKEALANAIPPAYSEFIGHCAMRFLGKGRVAA